MTNQRERTSRYSERRVPDLLSDVDEEAEMRLISCLRHPKISRRDIDLLPMASHISNEYNRAVYSSMVDVIQEQGRIDATVLFSHLRQKGIEPDNAYFRTLTEINSHPESIANYAAEIHKLSVRRMVKEAGLLFAEKSARHTGDADELLAFMDRTIRDIHRESSSAGYTTELVSFQQALETAWAKIVDPSKSKWISTGIPSLDYATGGLREGELVVIGGSAGGGKTSIAMQFILHSAAKSNKRWLMVSKEMAPEDLALRVLLMRANINSLDIRRAQMEEVQLDAGSWSRLNTAYTQLMALESADGIPHIMIMPPEEVTADSICAMIRREKVAHGLDGFVVDYLQILDKPTGAKANETEEAQIRRDCQSFKDVAVGERLAGVVLSQFVKRGSASRTKDGTNPRPVLDDLKGSQGVQAAADIILLLHRPDPPDELNSNLPYAMNCIIAKGRNVGTGDVHLDFEPQFTRFSDRNSASNEEGGAKW